VHILLGAITFTAPIAHTSTGRQKVSLHRETPTSGLQSLSSSEIKFLNLEVEYSSMQAVQSDQLKAGQLYKIPFLFVIPEFTSMGFARTWDDEEPLKNWHALLPPSINSSTRRSCRSSAITSTTPGRIQYSIVVNAYQESSTSGVQCFGSAQREIHISSRPWQVNLLDISPFVRSSEYPRQRFTKGLLRRTVATLILKPSYPPLGYHAIGQRTDDRISFQGEFKLIAWFKTQSGNVKMPRIAASSGRLHEMTSYRLNALSVADPFSGHSTKNVVEIQITQTHAHHWSTEEDWYEASECPFTELASEPTHTMIGSQEIVIAWRWLTHSEVCPSFSSALISRWYNARIKILYTGLDAYTTRTLECEFPIKLSVQPFYQSSEDAPIHQVPAYSEVALLLEESRVSIDNASEGPPPYNRL
jgi:hypothetical protein